MACLQSDMQTAPFSGPFCYALFKETLNVIAGLDPAVHRLDGHVSRGHDAEK